MPAAVEPVMNEPVTKEEGPMKISLSRLCAVLLPSLTLFSGCVTQEQKDQVYSWRFDDDLPLRKLMAAIYEQFGVKISKNKVAAQCNRWEFADALGVTEDELIALLNGEPVPVVMTVTIRFLLTK